MIVQLMLLICIVSCHLYQMSNSFSNVLTVVDKENKLVSFYWITVPSSSSRKWRYKLKSMKIKQSYVTAVTNFFSAASFGVIIEMLWRTWALLCLTLYTDAEDCFSCKFTFSFQILKQMWPYIDEYVRNLVKHSIEKSIQNSLPSSFNNFKFDTFDLGDTVWFINLKP